MSEGRKPFWRHRDVIATDIPTGIEPPVVDHKRIQVETQSGRCIEFERIVWSNGDRLVTAYDLTFCQSLRYWKNWS